MDYEKLLQQPIGNRIKKGSLLESKIREKLPNRADQILHRTAEYNFEEYQKVKNKVYQLRNEVEEG